MNYSILLATFSSKLRSLDFCYTCLPLYDEQLVARSSQQSLTKHYCTLRPTIGNLLDKQRRFKQLEAYMPLMVLFSSLFVSILYT